jgi:hypothetical protein
MAGMRAEHETAGARLAMAALLMTAIAGTGWADQTVPLTPVAGGDCRWRDASGNLYAAAYRGTYNYAQASVCVTFRTNGTLLTGTLHAINLKPNFAYQFKLEGQPESAPASNEALGFSGRWWEQYWTGTAWSPGGNLNSKGAGTYPNPNDLAYQARKNTANASSPTGLHYRYSGYRPLDYFITDVNGDATLAFTLDSAYHVLWRTNQPQYSWSSNDGPIKTSVFNPDPAAHPAYDVDFPLSSAAVYGEWERLPPDGIYLAPGAHSLSFLITEESFHGVDGTYSGTWAHAFRGAFTFTMVRPQVTVTLSPAQGGSASPSGTTAVDCGAELDVEIFPDAYWSVTNLTVAGGSVGATSQWHLPDIREDTEVVAHLNPQRTAGGVAHWWLASHLPASTNNFEAAVNADADGDDQPTGDEYFAGTDPDDADSFFRIDYAAWRDGRLELRWLTPCRDPGLGPFLVESAPGPDRFNEGTVYAVPPAATGTNTWQSPAPSTSASPRFFRITTAPNP